MRIPNPFLKTEYLIGEPLGEGLTSQVYKAIRRHRRLHIEQTVAVKILNSKNEVRTLKNEIGILSQIRSAHCVQLLGWEDLAQGPALVLEYLEGVSLAELSVIRPLDIELIDEILSQVQDGLRDLSKYKICHGDLSARNIFVTTSGVVKLLDFGFSGNKETTYGTPQFLAPEVWLGQPPSLAGDLFSLGLIREDLLQNTLISDKSKEYWKQRSLDKIGRNALLQSDPSSRDFLSIESRKEMRTELAEVARQAFDFRKAPQMTEKLDSSRKGISLRKKSHAKTPWLVSAGLFLFFHQLQPATQPLGNPSFHENGDSHIQLDVRSHRWAALSLYEKVGDHFLEIKKNAYAPVRFKNLRQGDYEVRWRSPQGSGKIPLSLQKSQRILIR
jgi:serine/threonine protein kinase